MRGVSIRDIIAFCKTYYLKAFRFNSYQRKSPIFITQGILRQPETPSLCLYYPPPIQVGRPYKLQRGGGLFNFELGRLAMPR